MARYAYRGRRVDTTATVRYLPSTPPEIVADPEPEPVAPEPTPDLFSLRKDELVALAIDRDVDPVGSRSELIGRLSHA